MSMPQFQSYENFQDSGVEWIGAIPDDWECRPLRSVFGFRNEKNDPVKTKQVLSLSIANGVTLYTDENRGGNRAKDDLTAYKIAHPNDIVLNSMNVVVGAVGRSDYFGAISPVYYALYLKDEKSCLAYYERIFSTYGFQRHLIKLGKGILVKKGDGDKLNTIRMKISTDDLKVVLFPIPPLDQQRAIARFLDDKTAKINEAISIKEQQIALLRERLKIIIQDTVTRGLNPAALMKDSGVDWIGQIPAHWEVMRLKYLLSDPLKYGANEEATECVEGDPRYIRITDFGSNGKLRDDTQRTLPWKIANEYLLESGDILLARSGGTVGKAFKFRDKIRACFAGYLIRARTDRKKMSPEHLYFFLRSPAFDCWKDAIFSRATIQNIGADKYATLTLPVPSLDEQNANLRHLDESEAKIGAAIEIKERQIAAIKEYKTSLINAAVTGKIRVI